MSVGVWEPGGANQDKVDADLLQRFGTVEIVEDQMDRGALSAAGVDGDSSVMKLGVDAWQVAQGLGSDQLEHLVRVFTLVEALPDWDAGSKSPVIALVKILKSRGDFSSDLRKWVKSHTDNRYLPYGSAL